jgi:hypothetical protein
MKELKYIHWKTDAKRVVLSNNDMKAKLKEVLSTRHEAKTNTKVDDYIDETTYKAGIYGDYAELYMCENGKFVIYCNNIRDSKKNTKEHIGRADRIFQQKFMELNGCGLEKAFGFVDKSLKRCIPKQFYYVDKSICDKTLAMSSIDASSQYASGCLGSLPDSHDSLYYEHYVEPTAEYPFAFYASGHVAIYNELDTHEWLAHKLYKYLFRLNQKEPWPFRPLPKEKEHTILMKASPYSMESTWRYFYNIKQSFPKDSKEYDHAKQVILEVMGQWHRKDKDQKRIMTYDDGGSFQLAHIVAVAIARGNQKILDKVEEIGLDFVVHICVDGIIYIGNEVFGQQKADLGVFYQEFTGVPTVIRDINVYMAKNKDNYKFRHAGYDLINNEEIDEDKKYDFVDLYNLSSKERIGDIIKQWADQKDQKTE